MTSFDNDLWFLDTRVRILVPAAAGTDRLSVMEHWAPHGDSPPLHVHDTEDEVFRILEGQVRFTIGGKDVDGTPGDTILAPKGVPHTYRVESPEGARFMTVTSPGDFEAMVRAASRPATADGLPARSGPPSPEMKQALETLCGNHAIRLVGPPLMPRQAA